MRFNIISFAVTIFVQLFSYLAMSQGKGPIDDRVETLLRKMTIEEKVGQMAQVTLDVLGETPVPGSFDLNNDKVRDALVKYKLGSVLNTSDNRAMSIEKWNLIIGRLQREAGQTRLQVPLLYGFDAIHGATYVAGATFFPQPIGQAATWNRELVRKAAVITAYESRAASVPWNFSPVLDLGMNPLWPRLWETYGEDPFLVSEMGKEAVSGYQYGMGPGKGMAACMKHFMAYSDPKNGKDRTNVWISENYLREYHLPSFRAAIRSGARSLMANSGLINGLPTHINKYLLTDVLKKELGFEGVVVTDWQDIENVYKRDKIVSSYKEAIMLSINAGIDMAMIPYDYKTFCDDLIALVRENKVPVERINDAVRRILRLKSDLGLFEKTVGEPALYADFGSPAFKSVAYECAAESITLLKNQNSVLPLSINSKILVTGPNANSMRTLNGGWSYSWQGEKTELFASEYNTILSAIQNRAGKDRVIYHPGVNYIMSGKYHEDSVADLSRIKALAAGVDYIILCLGENSYCEKPGDLNDLAISPNQAALAEAVMETGKPVILVLNEGRPRVISKIEPGLSAIVMTYLPGNFGADALADILFGKVNPGGKLPFTFPRYVNSLTNYIHKPSDQQNNPQGAYDYSADYNPQYDFGYGLSYTEFNYRDLSTDKTEYLPGDTILVSVTLRNSGKMEGKEVVQVYVSDLVASLTPDMKRLRAFEKVSLLKGEEKKVECRIPMTDLSFVDSDNKNTLEEGDYLIRVADLQTKVHLKRPSKF